jgi:hypothetical protein
VKYIINKKTGKRYCLHCKSYDCICLPEGEQYMDFDFATICEVKAIQSISPKCDKVWFYKQTLPNGRIIPSGFECLIPTGKFLKRHERPRLTVYISNDFLNQLVF